MKTISTAFLAMALLLTLAQPASAACVGDNTKPLFGYDENKPLNECDRNFLKAVLKEARGKKEVALNGVLKLGWDALEIGDLLTAIKRFNQAWLIDRNSREVFRGFYEWEKRNGNFVKAEEFRQRAEK